MSALTKKITKPWSETGKTVYAIIRREADLYRLNDADGAFAVNPTDPFLSLTEDAVSKGLYEVLETRTVWNDGDYLILIYRQTGAIPVPANDMMIGDSIKTMVNDAEAINVNTIKIGGTSLTAQIISAIVKFFNVASPTATCLSLPDAVPGVSGGLPTTNGTKVNQTVDLTASQSIACSDKTGFSLSATGADLILKSSTFIQAIVAAINELATYGLTALNTLLVTTGIKAATIPAATLANGTHGGPATVITLQTPIEANIASETNHDFTALQKTSLNAATPASIQNIPATGSGFTALGDARLSELEAANLPADIDGIKGKTVNLPTDPADESLIIEATNAIMTRIGAAGAGLTALGDARLAELEAANLPTDIANVKIDTAAILLDTGTDGVVVKASGLAADAVDEILDEVVEGTITLRQAIRILLAVLAGKSTGGGTVTLTFRDVADSKPRISATVDTQGNRTAIIRDGT